MSTADVVYAAVGAFFVVFLTFLAWLVQRSIERRSMRLDGMETKIDHLATKEDIQAVKDAIGAATTQVTAVANNLNAHLIVASADSARLADHLAITH